MIKNLFLSIGAMKAGTTWLYEQLKEHSDIHFTPEKEIHYFACVSGVESSRLEHEKRLEKLTKVLYSQNKSPNKKRLEKISWYIKYANSTKINDAWYQSLFAENKGKKYNSDFSNLYALLDKHGWMRVRDNCDNLRVIYVLRDPIKRMWSHYKFHMKWIGKEDEVISAGKEHFMELVQRRALWEPSEYHKTLNVLEDNLSRNEYKIYFSEDLHAEPEKYLYDIEEFLNIKHIAYDKNKAMTPKNQTKDFDLPEEWEAFLLKKLEPVYTALRSRELIHKDWKI